jgi:hypothetical protein
VVRVRFKELEGVPPENSSVPAVAESVTSTVAPVLVVSWTLAPVSACVLLTAIVEGTVGAVVVTVSGVVTVPCALPVASAMVVALPATARRAMAGRKKIRGALMGV